MRGPPELSRAALSPSQPRASLGVSLLSATACFLLQFTIVAAGGQRRNTRSRRRESRHRQTRQKPQIALETARKHRPPPLTHGWKRYYTAT